MLRTLLMTVTALGVMLPRAGHAAQLDELKSLNLNLPSSDMSFPDGPGADAMNGACLSCHSADHVLNQPSLSRAAWEEVVHKMINAYKAPIASQDVSTIVDYLVRTKGAK
jgi:hypothetical protein